MSLNPLVLVVEDDEAISNFIAAILTSNDYKIIKTKKGREAVSMASSYCPDLILLDLGLPDIDGIDVIKSIREWTNIPIIVVSARGHEREKVEALDLGADDYITKPFGTSELLARIRTELRHGQKAIPEDPIKQVGEIIVDISKRTISVTGEPIHLTPIEYKILLLLIKHAGKV
jgi:two-component system KDP operon response regulator KdpE